MKRYLLDTGIAGDYIDRRNGVYDRARAERQKGNVVGTCPPVLGELFFGAENSDTRDRALADLRLTIPDWRLWPFDLTAAEEFGRLAALLRRIGRPMQRTDIQIAAVARSIGKCTVVSSDSDLYRVPGLDVEDWSV